MKKTISTLALCLGLSLTFSSTPSKAFIILDPVDFVDVLLHHPLGTPLACLILLPYCLLDEETQSSQIASANDLLLNGYPNGEVSLIKADQDKFLNALASKPAALKITSNESKAQIAEQMRSLVPDISDTFINYLYEAHTGQ